MKSYRVVWATVALVVVWLVGSMPVMAQQGGGQGQRGQGRQGQDRTEQMMQRLTEQLSLTEAQQAKLKPILQEQSTKMREVWQDDQLSQEQKREKMTKIREAYDAKIKAVLTEEQTKKWEQIRQERRRGGQGQGGGQGGGRGQNR